MLRAMRPALSNCSKPTQPAEPSSPAASSVSASSPAVGGTPTTGLDSTARDSLSRVKEKASLKASEFDMFLAEAVFESRAMRLALSNCSKPTQPAEPSSPAASSVSASSPALGGTPTTGLDPTARDSFLSEHWRVLALTRAELADQQAELDKMNLSNEKNALQIENQQLKAALQKEKEEKQQLKEEQLELQSFIIKILQGRNTKILKENKALTNQVPT